MRRVIKKLFIPPKRYKKATWVLEFPKSGITYLLWFLGNYELLLAGNESRITWFNISTYVESEGGGFRVIDNPVQKRQFVKSHSILRRDMTSVIVLFRDLDDVMVSYFNYCTQLGFYHKDFNSFIRSRFGIRKWVRYYSSFDNAQVHQKIMVVRFEDLFSEPDMKEIIYNIFGSLDDLIFDECMRRCSLENMRASEEYYRKRNPFNALSFVGKKGKLKKEDLLDENYYAYKDKYKREIDIIYNKFA